MSKKRTLTVEEMRDIRNTQLAIEQAKKPGYEITVRVSPVTDDNGKPILTVERQRETKR